MGTVQEKVRYLEDTKVMIKSALLQKNIDVAIDDSFREYANKIKQIKAAPPLSKGGMRVVMNTSRATGDYGLLTRKEIRKVLGVAATGLTDAGYFFYSCDKLTDVNNFDTSGISDFQRFFYGCTALQNVSELEASSFIDISLMFYNCKNLTNFEGLKNLGKAYTNEKEKISAYSLNLADCSKLTHKSLINIVKKLYNLNLTYRVAEGGILYRQEIKLNKESYNLLTEEEKKIAIDKGWDIVQG